MWRWLIDRLGLARARSVGRDYGGSSDERVTVYARIGTKDLDSAVLESRAEKPESLAEPSPQLDAASSPQRADSRQRTRQKSDRSRTAAARFARKFSSMSPREAKLLFAIHRRSVQSVARENPAVLQRDLQRFVLSSCGLQMSRGRPVPNLTRIKTWVDDARQQAHTIAGGPRPAKHAL